MSTKSADDTDKKADDDLEISYRRKDVSHIVKTNTVAAFVAQCLIDCGVRHVFGGHGGAVVPLINAIIKSNENKEGLTWVYCRCKNIAN